MYLPARHYLKGNLPKRPSKTENAKTALPVLHQMMMNDVLSCCTAAGAFHIQGLLQGMAGIHNKFANLQIQQFYSSTCGYVPGQPATDQGGNEIDVLDYWRKYGLYKDGHRIAGHLSADASNVEEMKTLLWLFGNLYFGFEMPDDWVKKSMPSTDGFKWGTAGDPNPDNGHCFMAADYDDNNNGPLVDTWGLLGTLSWEAIEKYGIRSAGGEVHCVISHDMLVAGTQKAPNGFDWVSLVNDFNNRGGNVAALTHMIR